MTDTLVDPEEEMMKTFGDLLYIIDGYVDLDSQRKDGALSAEEFVDKLGDFMFPMVFEAMGLLASAGPGVLSPYIDRSKETFDNLRDLLIGSDEN